jgi:ectoine hydroxylase-related dioxygenase (phytanoyl-CoA dioxygenase family)
VTPLRTITDDEVATYRDDGVVRLLGLFHDEWVERLRAMTARSMVEHGQEVREYDTSDGGRFHANMFRIDRDDDLRAFVFESPAAAIAARLMESSVVSFFFDHLLVKEPGTVNPTPWHQDLPFWPVRGDQMCSIWFAMDHVDETSGGVRYVAGSHRWSTWYRAQSFGGTDKYSDESMPEAPDIDGDPELRIVSFDLQPGDVVVHHVMTMHGARGNASTARRRRGLATRWAGDDIVYDPRPKTMTLPWPSDVEAGRPLRSERFPIVLRSS